MLVKTPNICVHWLQTRMWVLVSTVPALTPLWVAYGCNCTAAFTNFSILYFKFCWNLCRMTDSDRSTVSTNSQCVEGVVTCGVVVTKQIINFLSYTPLIDLTNNHYFMSLLVCLKCRKTLTVYPSIHPYHLFTKHSILLPVNRITKNTSCRKRSLFWE